MIRWDDDAWQAVEALFQDPSRERLADRLEELLNVLNVLTVAPEDARVRRPVGVKPVETGLVMRSV